MSLQSCTLKTEEHGGMSVLVLGYVRQRWHAPSHSVARFSIARRPLHFFKLARLARDAPAGRSQLLGSSRGNPSFCDLLDRAKLKGL